MNSDPDDVANRRLSEAQIEALTPLGTRLRCADCESLFHPRGMRGGSAGCRADGMSECAF